MAAGYVPPADASVTVLPAPSGARAVVVGGTGWHVVAADVAPAWVAAEVAHDPLAAPLGARFLAAQADRVGAEPGLLDAVLVAPSPGVVPGADIPLQGMSDPGTTHPRIARAMVHRTDVRVWTTPDGGGLVMIGRGVAGRWETSTEVEPAAR